MDPRIDQPQPPLPPQTVQDLYLQADLRLFARVEASTILLQQLVDAGRVSAQQVDPPPPAPKAVDDLDRKPTPFYGAGRDLDPSLLGKRPYTPRVNATPMMVLSVRAAKLLIEAAKYANALAHDLVDRGVDIEKEVYKRRISDYVLQYLRECGIDITRAFDDKPSAMRYALDRIDDIIEEAIVRLGVLPGLGKQGRKQLEIDAQQSPQGP